MLNLLFWLALGLIAFHHALYPFLVKIWAKHKAQPLAPYVPMPESALPRITLIIPAYNERRFIAKKIAHLETLDYPHDKLNIIIALDGCTDETPRLAFETAKAYPQLSIDVQHFKINRGKVAVLNEVITRVKSDIIALSDVSALLTPDSLKRAAAHFENPQTGVVCGTYHFGVKATQGEKTYWAYQRKIKQDEAAVAAPLGAHGALYFFRKSLWQPLPVDTINDDFILPMQIVAQGYRSIYDVEIVATEIEPTRLDQDYRRRIRISAGNVQQAIRLKRLASLKNPALAFLFLGGKGLRAFLPFAFFVAFWANFALSFHAPFYSLLFLGQSFLYLLVLCSARVNNRYVKAVNYLVRGHFAGLIGAIHYFLGFQRSQWLVSKSRKLYDGDFVSPAVRYGKRALDIGAGLIVFIVFLALLPLIAMLIKATSQGPVFFKQIRVGESTQSQTNFFYLYKFRSMFTDAESRSGAVWASKDDPRVTLIGKFMRKTRIDELPQAINVLKGEMSLVGPRPERPSFFAQLEKDIPYFSERICSLKPGITGLAQVSLGYPTTIEETREKVMLDHAYSLRISGFWNWLKTDMLILCQTVGVVVLKKGH
jgi:lipopolysaccharide/colanic/teichoic acid biosynthesis glycosyltransferase